MKRILIVILVCLCVTACTAQEGTTMKLSPLDATVFELVSTKYTLTKLNDIANSVENMDSLDAAFPIECIRRIGERYRVAYCGDNHIALLFFDANGDFEYSRVVSFSPAKDSFTELSKCALEDVQRLDPTGDYSFLYMGRNDYLISNHYTSDGFWVKVEYDQNLNVKNIAIELI